MVIDAIAYQERETACRVAFGCDSPREETIRSLVLCLYAGNAHRRPIRSG